MLIKEEKRYYLLFENWMVLIHLKLNSHHPGMLCAKFGWNWPSGSGEDGEKLTDGWIDGLTTESRWSEKLIELSVGELKTGKGRLPVYPGAHRQVYPSTRSTQDALFMQAWPLQSSMFISHLSPRYPLSHLHLKKFKALGQFMDKKN